MMPMKVNLERTYTPVISGLVDPEEAPCYTGGVPLYGPHCGYITAPSISVKRIATFPIYLPDLVPSIFITS